MLGCGFGCNHSAQKHGRHIPLVTVIGDHSDCFSVASGHDAGLGIMTRCVEGHPVTDLDVLHLLLHAYLLQIAQACNDFLIQLRELNLAEFGDVDGHGATMSNYCGWLPAVRQQFVDATVHVTGQSRQHVLEIRPRVMPMQLC